MAKDYAKFVPPKPRRSRKKSFRPGIAVVILFIVGVCATMGFFLYEKVSHPDNFAALMVRVAAFIHHDKQHVVKIHKVAVADDSQPPTVHFDFYSELPTMQVAVDDEQDDKVVPVNKSPVPVIAKIIATAASDAKVSEQHIFNPDDVENQLAAESDIQLYSLQLGSFESMKAASSFVARLSSAGIKADIVQSQRGSQTVFSVQQGPFTSKALVDASQQRLQKKGITSTILKSV